MLQPHPGVPELLSAVLSQQLPLNLLSKGSTALWTVFFLYFIYRHLYTYICILYTHRYKILQCYLCINTHTYIYFLNSGFNYIIIFCLLLTAFNASLLFQSGSKNIWAMPNQQWK